MSKVIVGTVASTASDKTITVVNSGRRTHPIYKKQYPVSKRYLAHDEKNEASVGDLVAIVECRPISARKRFTLDKIIEKPKLREDKLAATKDEDTAKRPDSKSKKDNDEEEDSK